MGKLLDTPYEFSSLLFKRVWYKTVRGHIEDKKDELFGIRLENGNHRWLTANEFSWQCEKCHRPTSNLNRFNLSSICDDCQ